MGSNPMPMPLPPPIWVATPEDLKACARVLAMQPSLAVDTESNSLYAYREQVCLLQFSTLQADYLIDPLALDNLTPLADVLDNPGIEKVFHAAEYDLICLKRDFGFTLNNIFDTRWAARLLGYQGDGLDYLLSRKFGLHQDKKYQRANWARRPLPPEQINYARLDTRYLLPLRDILHAELESRNLAQLAREDFQRACKVEIPSGRPPLWERMGNNHTFTPRELTILKALYDCRERIARQLDRPPFKVMGDRQLFDIARVPPQHPDELLGLGLSPRQVMRWGRDILEAVQKGQTAPLVKPQQAPCPSEAYLSRLEGLKSWRKSAARKMGVESDVVLPRWLMELLAERGPQNMEKLADSMSDSPWRMAHFGPQILQAMKG
ncbi:MAG: ribonuclease D [Anaerolineales bacterium]